jgi:hypothetical protein
MKYAVEMGLGAMTYIPSSIKIGSGILISLLLFLKNKDSRLKTAADS